MQLADDAKREAEARKVTEGQYRTKRRGKDFYSEDEDESPRKKRWSKKQMRQRKIWKEDGLDKLGMSVHSGIPIY
jgi:mediator of replication checkpoint protein 1